MLLVDLRRLEAGAAGGVAAVGVVEGPAAAVGAGAGTTAGGGPKGPAEGPAGGAEAAAGTAGATAGAGVGTTATGGGPKGPAEGPAGGTEAAAAEEPAGGGEVDRAWAGCAGSVATDVTGLEGNATLLPCSAGAGTAALLPKARLGPAAEVGGSGPGWPLTLSKRPLATGCLGGAMGVTSTPPIPAEGGPKGPADGPAGGPAVGEGEEVATGPGGGREVDNGMGGCGCTGGDSSGGAVLCCACGTGGVCGTDTPVGCQW